MLSGKITGVRAGNYTNVGVGGAGLDIFAVDGTTGLRHGSAAYHVTTAADGRWGPFKADPHAYYEFVVTLPRPAGDPHLSLAVPARLAGGSTCARACRWRTRRPAAWSP